MNCVKLNRPAFATRDLHVAMQVGLYLRVHLLAISGHGKPCPYRSRIVIHVALLRRVVSGDFPFYKTRDLSC